LRTVLASLLAWVGSMGSQALQQPLGQAETHDQTALELA
jgi:hypothetical protein